MSNQKRMRQEKRSSTDGKTTAEPLRFEPATVVEGEASTSAIRPETTDLSRQESVEQEYQAAEFCGESETRHDLGDFFEDGAFEKDVALVLRSLSSLVMYALFTQDRQPLLTLFFQHDKWEGATHLFGVSS